MTPERQRLATKTYGSMYNCRWKGKRPASQPKQNILVFNIGMYTIREQKEKEIRTPKKFPSPEQNLGSTPKPCVPPSSRSEPSVWKYRLNNRAAFWICSGSTFCLASFKICLKACRRLAKPDASQLQPLSPPTRGCRKPQGSFQKKGEQGQKPLLSLSRKLSGGTQFSAQVVGNSASLFHRLLVVVRCGMLLVCWEHFQLWFPACCVN